jgi:hypothetical protein
MQRKTERLRGPSEGMGRKDGIKEANKDIR